MSSLRDWLDSQELATETVKIAGHEFLAKEISLSQRGRLLAGHADDGDEVIELVLVAASICDPATGEPIEPDYKYWQTKGAKFSPLIAAAVRVNGLDSDATEDEVKN
jgi:hypothetical protein